MDEVEKKISLLPEEMRKKESEEQRRKEPAFEAVKFHIPEPEKKAVGMKPPETFSQKKQPSLFANIFGSPEKRAERRKKKEEEKKKKMLARETARRKKEEERRAKKETEKRRAAEAVALKKRGAVLNNGTPKVSSIPRPIPSEEVAKKIVQPPTPLSAAPETGDRKKPALPAPRPPAMRQEKKPERKVDEVPHGMRVSFLSEEMLFPAEKRFASKFLVFLLTQFGIILIVLVAYFWMVWQESQVKTTEGNINEQLAAVEALTAQKERQLKDVKGLQTQAGIFKNLLDAHVYWTQFLTELEKNTVQGVYYTSIAADANGGVVLAAHAPNYETVARQLVAFEEAKDFVSAVRIAAASGETGDGGILKGVSFDIHLEIASKVFHK